MIRLESLTSFVQYNVLYYTFMTYSNFITCLCEIKRFDWLTAEGNNMFRIALPRNDF